MPGPDDGLGKKAEQKIKAWLDKPESGYSFDRIPDQMTGFYAVSRNICDFVCYKYPNIYYIESKSTWNDRFDFSMISDTQFLGLLNKSKIDGCFGLIIILFASHKRAFILDIRDIHSAISSGVKSINIKKLSTWNLPYIEIETIQSRKDLLDYCSDFEGLVKELESDRNRLG